MDSLILDIRVDTVLLRTIRVSNFCSSVRAFIERKRLFIYSTRPTRRSKLKLHIYLCLVLTARDRCSDYMKIIYIVGAPEKATFFPRSRIITQLDWN